MSVLEDGSKRVRQTLLTCRRELETLEAAAANSGLDPAASSSVHNSFRTNLSSLQTELSTLRTYIPREAPSRREVWRMRLRDWEEQVTELHGADVRIASKFRSIAAEASVRDELFQRRTRTIPSTNTHTHNGDAVIGFGHDSTNHHATYTSAWEHKTLDSSQSGVTGILSTGTNALDALVNQRIRLKGARKKVMDVMNTMTAGRKLIAQIERRDQRDKVLLFGMMALTLLLLSAAVFYKRVLRHH